MKKTVITAILLVISLCFCTLAVQGSELPQVPEVDVYGNFAAGEQAETVYKVDITWGSMVFNYTAASEGVWNPDNHSFEDIVPAAWTHEEGANKINITNHSNAQVTVGFGAALAEGIEAGFTDADGEGNAVQSLLLESAVGTSFENAPAADVYFNIKSGDVEASGKIGTITVVLN